MQSTSKGINKSLPISTQKEKHKTHWKNSFDRNQNKISRAFATPSRLSLATMSWFFSSGWPPASIFLCQINEPCVFPINGPPIFCCCPVTRLTLLTRHLWATKSKSPEAWHWWMFMPSDRQFCFLPKKLTDGKIKRLVKYFFPPEKLEFEQGDLWTRKRKKAPSLNLSRT